ncbi:TolC family protein [Arcticibacter sp. MXS-1]|uniref:TolC family protein n=1 Tax=Arcticibacter sp. MXS-1 TaxID=3341726 RepID=UPI0035A8FDF8
MKKLLFILMGILMAVSAHSQTLPPKQLALVQAMQTAIQRRYDVKANKLDVDLASNKISKSRNEWLPTLKADGEVRYNAQLQTMILDGFGSSGGKERIEVGTTNFTTLSMDLSQNIFKPGLKADIDIAKAEKKAEQEKTAEKENTIRMQVAEAYLNVILKQQQLLLAKENTQRYREYLNVSSERKRLGTILETDLLKAQTDLENAKLTEKESAQNYELAMKALKYQMNVNDETPLALTDSLQSLMSTHQLSEYHANMEERPELKQLAFMKEANDLKVRKENYKWAPTLSLTGNYTTLYQAADFKYISSMWTPYNYIGLKASLPITELFTRSVNKKEFRIKASQLDMQYQQKQQDLNYEVDKNQTELRNTTGNVQSAGNSLTLSRSMQQNQLNNYKLGTITYSSVLDAEATINTAEQNYVKAVYNYLLAYYNFEKLNGFAGSK